MHLPSLRRLEDRFAVTAVADASASVARRVAGHWGVAAHGTDWREAIGRADVDAVLVTCPNAYHADVTLAALRAGKHVLVEKPMCITRREADAIVAAREDTGLVVQVGYMRRYPAAFRQACRRVAAMPRIRLARVRNLLGANELIGDQAFGIARPDDLTPADAGRPAADQAALLREELGEDASAEDLHTYFFLLSLATHDFSAMRDLIGMPEGILYATRREGTDGPMVTAAFDYGAFVCHYEAGFDRLPRVEQDLRVYGEDAVVDVAYDTGYVRNLPVRLTVTEALGTTGTATRVAVPSWEDPFVSEWTAFHASVTAGAPVLASPADARLDLELCRALTEVVAGATRSPVHA
jgi:predicted dehydrogenase